MMREFTLEDALANPSQHHWTDISVHEVMDGYCLEFYNVYMDVRIESPVMESLKELLSEHMYMICYGRSVSPYQENSGIFSLHLYGSKAYVDNGKLHVGIAEKNRIFVTLGNTYYHGIGGRYAFSPKACNARQANVLTFYDIAEQLAEILIPTVKPAKPDPVINNSDDRHEYW